MHRQKDNFSLFLRTGLPFHNTASAWDKNWHASSAVLPVVLMNISLFSRYIVPTVKCEVSPSSRSISLITATPRRHRYCTPPKPRKLSVYMAQPAVILASSFGNFFFFFYFKKEVNGSNKKYILQKALMNMSKCLLQQQQRIGSFTIAAFMGIHDNGQYSGRTQPCVSKQTLLIY